MALASAAGPLAAQGPTKLPKPETSTAPAASGSATVEIPIPLRTLLAGETPTDVEQLKAMQTHVRLVGERVKRCTVAVQVGNSEGSGVLVSEDGLILTASHVFGKPGRELKVLLADGRTVDGLSLGANRGLDCGMVRITTPGRWPYLELARSSAVRPGAWCLALGHPGGPRTDRPPVVRLGRVVEARRDYLRTDCKIAEGDSGGPLADMQGRLLGIHSWISESLNENHHIPADTYRDSWNRLLSSETWGRGRAFAGLYADPDSEDCRIIEVLPNSPAALAGVQVGDVLLRIADDPIADRQDLIDALRIHTPEETVELEILRRGERRTLKLTFDRRPQ